MHAKLCACSVVGISLLNTYYTAVDRQIKLNLFTYSSILLSEMLEPHYAADASILGKTSMLMQLRMLVMQK